MKEKKFVIIIFETYRKLQKLWHIPLIACQEITGYGRVLGPADLDGF